MICRNCGTEYNSSDKFCPACGTETARAPRHYKPEQSADYNDSYSRQNSRAQAQYQQPVQTVYVNDSEPHYDEHVSVGGWIGRWFLMCIPIVSIVMLFVWAFGGTRKYSLKTWARAHLLLALIWTLIAVIIVVVLLVMGVNVNDLLANARYY